MQWLVRRAMIERKDKESAGEVIKKVLIPVEKDKDGECKDK